MEVERRINQSSPTRQHWFVDCMLYELQSLRHPDQRQGTFTQIYGGSFHYGSLALQDVVAQR